MTKSRRRLEIQLELVNEFPQVMSICQIDIFGADVRCDDFCAR
jgi:hypothetical protein